jgi:hypothetical protein
MQILCCTKTNIIIICSHFYDIFCVAVVVINTCTCYLHLIDHGKQAEAIMQCLMPSIMGREQTIPAIAITGKGHVHKICHSEG